MNDKYDFKKMVSDLNYIGNNDPYVSVMYFRLLDQLEELAELQEEGKLYILPEPLMVSDLDTIKDIGRIVNNLEDMSKLIEKDL